MAARVQQQAPLRTRGGSVDGSPGNVEVAYQAVDANKRGAELTLSPR